MIVYIHLPGFYVRSHQSERPVVVVKSRKVLDANLRARRAGVEGRMPLSVAKSILAKNPLPDAPIFIEWKEDEYDRAQRHWLDRCVEFSEVIEPAEQHSAYIDLSAHPHPE